MSDQRFPQVALVGPRTLEEIRTTLAGITIELSEQTMALLGPRADTR